ncbi:MAG: hypothetical protein Q7S61_03320 [bacterium]|nr:hypothetical protein [bacterium]
MNYISTTDLRTQSSQLVDLLKLGEKISLVHRSRVIGEISPVKSKTKTFDVKKFRGFIKTAKTKNNLSYQERDDLYRKHLEEKYGKDLS